ncbi:RDD family protein [Isoptericola sp. QY 916]|uniref:RDD family protein n=1 Tax=Isoptericola sp. QY 916 TaxID=2782570 RepID=UPI003D2FA8CD|nr:RDD family protein [Isoptericola sp. QY 916]
MTTTCTACGAPEQRGAFCSVCGTPTVATGYRTPGPATGSLEVTTEPELRERTRRAPDDVARAAAAPPPVGEPPLAGVGRRAGAYVLDLLALSLLVGAASTVTALAVRLPARVADAVAATTPMGSEAAARDALGAYVVVSLVGGAVSLLGWFGLALWEGRTGRTVGNSALGIRTVALDGGGPVGAGRGVLRWLVLAGCGVLPLVGTVLVLVSPTFDSSGRRQGWQDKAARSVVRDVRGVSPRSFAPASPSAPGDIAPGTAQGAAQGSPPTEDPWAFPAAQRAVGGLITGVPGTAAPAGEPEAPQAAGVDAHTVHRASAAAQAAAPEPAPTQQQRAVPAVTPEAPAAPPVPIAAPVPAPAPAPQDDLDDLEATRFSVSSRRSAGDGSMPPRIVVEVDPERRVHVAARTLVGRQPQQDGGAPATLLSVEDPTRSVSKTHLELVPTQDGLRVTDLGSTNGSAVIAPGGQVQELVAGRPVTVAAGWVVQAGARRLTVVGQDAGA